MSQSNELMPHPNFQDATPLHETADFAVFVGPWPNPMWKGQVGYHILNKRTYIIEGVIGTEAMAISEMNQHQAHLDAVLSGGGPEQTADDAAFQDMMHRLSSRPQE